MKLRVYKTALFLSLSGIAAIGIEAQDINLEQDLVARYLFEGNVRNAVGDIYHGIPYEVSYTPDREMEEDRSASFNGTNALVKLPSAFDFESRSISVWFLAREISVYNRVYISDNPDLIYGSTNIDVFYDSQSGNTYLRMECGGGQGKDLLVEIEEGIWYHAVLTIGPDEVKAYLNGQLYDETSSSLHVSNTGDSNAFVGTNRFGLNNFFTGSIDDLYIYSRTLKACEIEALYSGHLLEER